MCESNVYIEENESEKLVMEDVALLKVGNGRIRLVDLLGEEKELQGRVKEISFLDHKVIIGQKE
jgi:predicted RNA-binding protein